MPDRHPAAEELHKAMLGYLRVGDDFHCLLSSEGKVRYFEGAAIKEQEYLTYDADTIRLREGDKIYSGIQAIEKLIERHGDNIDDWIADYTHKHTDFHSLLYVPFHVVRDKDSSFNQVSPEAKTARVLTMLKIYENQIFPAISKENQQRLLTLPDITAGANSSPFQEAVITGNVTVLNTVMRLLDQYLPASREEIIKKLSTPNSLGFIPLIASAREGHTDMFRRLVSLYRELGIEEMLKEHMLSSNDYGNVLHLSIGGQERNPNPEIIQAVIKELGKIADGNTIYEKILKVTNMDGFTPFDSAENHVNREVARASEVMAEVQSLINDTMPPMERKILSMTSDEEARLIDLAKSVTKRKRRDETLQGLVLLSQMSDNQQSEVLREGIAPDQIETQEGKTRVLPEPEKELIRRGLGVLLNLDEHERAPALRELTYAPEVAETLKRLSDESVNGDNIATGKPGFVNRSTLRIQGRDR